MIYLPDTNIFIASAKGFSPEAEFLSKIINKKQVMISSVVAAEFLARASDQEQKTFEPFLSEFKILNIDIEIARTAAEYRKQSLKTKKVHLLDCFLAAQAKLHGLTLVTNNKADFPMKDIKIITPATI